MSLEQRFSQLKSYPMVVESWKLVKANQNVPLFARGTFQALANSMHKTVHHRAHGCLRAMGLEREESRRVVSSGLSGVLEVKYDLHVDRTGMKNRLKKGQKLQALECAPGCTSWICSNWTAGITAVQHKCWLDHKQHLLGDTDWLPAGKFVIIVMVRLLIA